MKNSEQPWMAGSLEQPPEKPRQAHEHWYSFLADECGKDNGLLCFYDRNKSPEVAYFCGLLVNCLTGSGDEAVSEDPERDVDLGALLGPGENFFASLKSLTKG